MSATKDNNINNESPPLRISKNLIFLTILFMPFFRPNGINGILPGGQYVYDALSMASLGILVIIYLSGEKQLIDWQIILSGLMFLVILFSTLKNHGDTMVHIRVTVTCFGMMLGVSNFRKTPRLLMSALLLNSEILIYINLICLFLFPGGMYLSHITYGAHNNWWMGYDNHWFVFYYVAYFLALVNILYGGNKWRSLFLIVVLHLTSLHTFSGVLIVGMLMMDVLLLLKIYQWKMFNFEVIFAGGLLMSIVLVFFQTIGSIQYVIENILGKSDSMSARARIWRAVIGKIKEHPILGNGRFFLEQAQVIYGLPAAANAHNMWLEVLVEGGIVAFALFVAIIFAISVKNKKNRSVFYQVLLIPVAVSLVMMSVDAMMETRGVMFFAMMSIGYNCKFFETAVDEKAASYFGPGDMTLSLGKRLGKLRKAAVFDKLIR